MVATTDTVNGRPWLVDIFSVPTWGLDRSSRAGMLAIGYSPMCVRTSVSSGKK